jgi:SNF2 family DNA or RNA helicase
MTASSGMWNHQRAAVAFAAQRAATMLNMGMGTGKTRVTIQLLDDWNAKRVAVLAPLNVARDAWRRQMAMFASDGWCVLILDRSSVARRSALLAQMLQAKLKLLVVINYDVCWRQPLRKLLLAQAWDVLVLDEIHKIKAPFGKTSRFVADLSQRARRRLGLTGTIMPNSPLDAWAQYRALDHRVLGSSFVAFRAQYAVMSTRGGFPRVVGYRDQAGLAARIATLTFKCERDVLELPEAMSESISVELSAEGRRVYTALRDELRAEAQDGRLTVDNALTRLLRLQQITGGAMPTDEGGVVEIDTSKRAALQEIIEDSGDEPIVVFARFQHDLDAIHAAAKLAGTTSLELSGRRRDLEAWQAGAARVIAVQQQSGGLGIDLTRARYAVFYSLGFSLGDYEQALARTHRPGQTRPVVFYHLVATGTVDEVVYAALSKKKRVVDSVLDHLQTHGDETDGSDVRKTGRHDDPDGDGEHGDADADPDAEGAQDEAAAESAQSARDGS